MSLLTEGNAPQEVLVLALAGLLQILQFFLLSIPANREVGTKRTAGPRDEPLVLSGTTGRLHRALNNHFEGLIIFTLAVVVVTLSGQSSGVTIGCAWVYLTARILYVPAYVSGIMYLRSFIWMFGFGATVLMLLAALV